MTSVPLLSYTTGTQCVGTMTCGNAFCIASPAVATACTLSRAINCQVFDTCTAHTLYHYTAYYNIAVITAVTVFSDIKRKLVESYGSETTSFFTRLMISAIHKLQLLFFTEQTLISPPVDKL